MPPQLWMSSSVASTRTPAWEKQGFLVSACTPTTQLDESWSTVYKEALRCTFTRWNSNIWKTECAAAANTKPSHVIVRFVTLSPNGSRPLRSTTLANLRTPGPSAWPTRTGRAGLWLQNPKMFFLKCIISRNLYTKMSIVGWNHLIKRKIQFRSLMSPFMSVSKMKSNLSHQNLATLG